MNKAKNDDDCPQHVYIKTDKYNAVCPHCGNIVLIKSLSYELYGKENRV